MAHSGQVALVALARGREVGVDVEQTGREVAWEQVARRFFAPSEWAALEALPEARRRGGFFACWTRKEAYLKARGRGLSVGLSTFAVSLRPEDGHLTWSAGDPLASEWWLVGLEPGEGYAGAVCARGAGWRLRCRQWRC